MSSIFLLIFRLQIDDIFGQIFARFLLQNHNILWLEWLIYRFDHNVSSESQFQHGMRQAPECLDSAHISVRLRELLKAENRRFYGCSPFAGTGPRVSSTYHTAGRREAIVSTCSPLLDRFMIKVSTQYIVNLVAYLGRAPIKLLSS